MGDEMKKNAAMRNEKMLIDSSRPPTSPLKKLSSTQHASQKQPGVEIQAATGIDVDEMGTIHLIDSLHPESKKVLNSLVQSVLVTQQENDKKKLEIIGQKRAFI